LECDKNHYGSFKFNKFDKDKPVALVTGATSGIGLAIANALIDAGFVVYGAGRRTPTIQLPGGYIFVPMDVSLDDSVQKAKDRLLAEVSHIDLVVCAAGYGISGSIEDTPIEMAHAQFEVNFFGVVRVVHAFLPSMRAQGYGKIIVIGSIAGKIGMPFFWLLLSEQICA